jgi:hypothetical protein
MNHKYNISHIQRELDFTSNFISNSSTINTPNSTQINKFNINSFIPHYNNLVVNYSQTPQNCLKSFSFLNNNYPNTFVPINTNNIIPFEFNKPINNTSTVININNKPANQIPDSKFISKEDHYNDYKINLENIISGKDKRTTIMLRNIPNKYTLSNLVEEINQVYLGKIDYINLPIDYEVKNYLAYKSYKQLSLNLEIYKEINFYINKLIS